MYNKYFAICHLPFAICYLLFLMGCATTSLVAPPTPGIPGIYHRIERSQTLWGISKIYNVDLDELVRINRISDVTSLEIGQLIFIPYGKKEQVLVNRPLLIEDFIWPIKGRVVSSFGQTFDNMINKGLNIQPKSSLDVIASRSGKVIFYADNLPGFGKTVIIDHGDGFSTVYTRNSEVFVKAGDTVQQKTVIAKISPSAYLHFQIRKKHIPQNPYFYLP